jgi:hypothetical protein
MKNSTLERWIRRAALTILIGLVIEAITLGILHPLSFMTFATVGVLALLAGVAMFLVALLRATSASPVE